MSREYVEVAKAEVVTSDGIAKIPVLEKMSMLVHSTVIKAPVTLSGGGAVFPS